MSIDRDEKNCGIPYEIRKQWFYDNPLSRWPKIDEEETNKPKSKRGRKPKPSKRIVNKSNEHYKWWRE
jgi:hypothetical protein